MWIVGGLALPRRVRMLPESESLGTLDCTGSTMQAEHGLRQRSNTTNRQNLPEQSRTLNAMVSAQGNPRGGNGLPRGNPIDTVAHSGQT